MRSVLAAALRNAAETIFRPPSKLGLNLTRTAVIGDSLSARVGASPGRAYDQLVDVYLSRYGGDYRAWAKGGATALRWLAEYPRDLDSMAWYRPTAVLIMLGGNDYLIGRDHNVWTWYAQELVKRVRTLAPNAQLAFVRYYDPCAYGFDCDAAAASAACDYPGACEDEPDPRPTWENYGGAMNWTALHVGARYIDLADTPPPPSGISADLVHLNDAGHRFFADRLIEAL
jgi:lysophospholipase L1-like esterase